MMPCLSATGSVAATDAQVLLGVVEKERGGGSVLADINFC